eukprot:superscaffoldBa00003582_g17267
MKTKEDLLKTLEDLIEKDFEDFKWFLKDEMDVSDDWEASENRGPSSSQTRPPRPLPELSKDSSQSE